MLENSGVAEPQNIRDKFNEAVASGHPLMERIELDTLVTVVDSGKPGVVNMWRRIDKHVCVMDVTNVCPPSCCLHACVSFGLSSQIT